jgi:MraZ protein
MSNFLGEFECRLDPKGRLALPVALKKQLPLASEGRLVINRGFEKHLSLYPYNEWQHITAELGRLNLYVKKHREFVRYFHRGATELSLDASGRVLLPRRLLDYAEIQEDIILLAYANRIECWNPDLYDRLLTSEPDDFAALAEEIMGRREPSRESVDSLPDLRDLPPAPPGRQH